MFVEFVEVFCQRLPYGLRLGSNYSSLDSRLLLGYEISSYSELEGQVEIHFPLSTLKLITTTLHYPHVSTMTKVRISFTLDEETAKEIDVYLREVVTEAAKSGKPMPRQSNIYEAIVKKGWESLKRAKK